MRMRRLAAPALGAALLLATAAPAADPKPAANGGPLPDGAVLRLGSAGGRIPADFVPVPPDYTTSLVPTDDGFRVDELATGRTVAGGGARPTESRVATVSADGKRAVVVRRGVLTVRAVPGGEVVREVRPNLGAGDLPLSLSADGSRLAVAWADGKGGAEVGVWDVAKDAQVARFRVPHAPPVQPVLSPNGTVVAVRGALSPQPGRPTPEPAVTVWNAAEGRELFRAAVTEPGADVAAAFSPDGSFLATGSGAGPVDLWEVPAGRRRTLLGVTGQGYRVAFAPDGKTLAAVGVDGGIQRWSLPDGKRSGATDLPDGPVTIHPVGVGVTPDGRAVAWGATGTAGRSGLAWEAPAGKFVTPRGEHSDGITSVGFGAGGKEVVTAGRDGRVVRWDRATGRPLAAVPLKTRLVGGPGTPLRGWLAPPHLTLAADGSRAVSRAAHHAVYDVATGDELFAVPGARSRPGGDAVPVPSAELTRLAVLSAVNEPGGGGRLTVWDGSGERAVFETELPGTTHVRNAAFSPDNAVVVAVTVGRVPGEQREAALVTGWEVATGRKIGHAEDPGLANLDGLAVAGATSAVLAAHNRVWVVDFAAGRVGDEVEPDRTRGARGPVVFSPDGARFAAAVSPDERAPGRVGAAGRHGVRVYGWPKGAEVRTFTGHDGPVSALRFSPDGKTLASGSEDGTVLLWDVGDPAPKK